MGIATAVVKLWKPNYQLLHLFSMVSNDANALMGGVMHEQPSEIGLS